MSANRDVVAVQHKRSRSVPPLIVGAAAAAADTTPNHTQRFEQLHKKAKTELVVNLLLDNPELLPTVEQNIIGMITPVKAQEHQQMTQTAFNEQKNNNNNIAAINVDSDDALEENNEEDPQEQDDYTYAQSFGQTAGNNLEHVNLEVGEEEEEKEEEEKENEDDDEKEEEQQDDCSILETLPHRRRTASVNREEGHQEQQHNSSSNTNGDETKQSSNTTGYCWRDKVLQSNSCVFPNFIGVLNMLDNLQGTCWDLRCSPYSYSDALYHHKRHGTRKGSRTRQFLRKMKQQGDARLQWHTSRWAPNTTNELISFVEVLIEISNRWD